MTPETPIGFIGLGMMGAPMSRRLVEAGFAVHAFDVNTEAVTALSHDTGVVGHKTAASVAGAAETVILMLPNSAIVSAVLLDGGVIDAATAGTRVVDMSSSEPLRTRDLAERAQRGGVRLLDAPVSGGVSGALNGSLTIMVGGASEDFEALQPVFSTLGKRVTHVGPVGAGHAVKALNNMMSATHLLSTSEALLAAVRFGLDPAVVLEVVNGSSGRSGSTENKWPNFVLTEGYNSGFALDLMLKDMKIALALQHATGVSSSLGEAAVKAWSEASTALDHADHTEIVRWLEAMSPATKEIGDRS